MNIKGIPQLKARLNAITPNPDLMRALALHAVAEQKKIVPRQTGNLGRSIGIGRVTDTSAETIATANYAAFVEFGTKGGQDIVPKRAKALRFAVGGKSSLAGRHISGGTVIFTKRVKRGATRAQPYMVPGAHKALDNLGVDAIVKAWNDAA